MHSDSEDRGATAAAKSVYPRPNVIAGVTIPLELATLPYAEASRLWRRIYFRRILLNPLRLASFALLVTVIAFCIFLLTSSNFRNLRSTIPWIFVAIGVSYAAIIGSLVFDLQFLRPFLRTHPRFMARRAEMPDEIIRRVGEPTFATLRIYVGVVRAGKRRHLLNFPFDSGLYGRWVENYGDDEAAKRYWRHIQRQGWRLNFQDMGLQLRNPNKLDIE